LELVLKNQDEMTLAEIARLSNLSKPTVHRIVSTLVARKYLSQPKKGGKYSLGKIYLQFNQFLQNKLQIEKIATPYLSKLSQLTHELVTLAYIDESGLFFSRAYNEGFQADDILRIELSNYSNVSWHCTSWGKIMLSDMSDEELTEHFQSKDCERYTPNTITNIDDMKNHLLLVRREEVAVDDEEYNLGVRSIAVGLRNRENKLIGIISIIAPSVRLTREKLMEIVPDIKDCAIKISKELEPIDANRLI